MFRNYLLVTLRNLYKNKIYALINILGLGMALAICIVAYFNHMFGYNFDRENENFEEIYRVIGVVKDFYTSGMWSKIEPMMMKLSPEDRYRTM